MFNRIEQSAVFIDLQEQFQTNDLLQWIENRAEELSVLGETHSGKIIFTHALRDACKVVDIISGKIGSRAQILSEGDRFRILFRPQLTEDARRFAIAHEIGHTIWFKPGSRKDSRTSTIVGHNDYILEGLCDYFAGALLMPYNPVLAILEANKHYKDGVPIPPLHLIKDLAVKFHIQERIVAWRLLMLGNFGELIILGARDRTSRNGPLFTSPINRPEWETLWYTTGSLFSKIRTVKGYAVPFNTRRRLPPEMIPDSANRVIQTCYLDHRWWLGLKPLPTKEARRSLKHISREKEVYLGHALLNENFLYLALPMDQKKVEVESHTL